MVRIRAGPVPSVRSRRRCMRLPKSGRRTTPTSVPNHAAEARVVESVDVRTAGAGAWRKVREAMAFEDCGEALGKALATTTHGRSAQTRRAQSARAGLRWDEGTQRGRDAGSKSDRPWRAHPQRASVLRPHPLLCSTAPFAHFADSAVAFPRLRPHARKSPGVLRNRSAPRRNWRVSRRNAPATRRNWPPREACHLPVGPLPQSFVPWVFELALIGCLSHSARSSFVCVADNTTIRWALARSFGRPHGPVEGPAGLTLGTDDLESHR